MILIDRFINGYFYFFVEDEILKIEISINKRADFYLLTLIFLNIATTFNLCMCIMHICNLSYLINLKLNKISKIIIIIINNHL